MDPEIYRAVSAEWNRLQAEASGDQADKQAELDRTRKQLERLIDAIANGVSIAAIQARLTTFEARRIALEAELASATAAAPALRPSLPEIYRGHIE